ncbi:hypothetical protein ES704_03669 [subsurface metagenome]
MKKLLTFLSALICGLLVIRGTINMTDTAGGEGTFVIDPSNTITFSGEEARKGILEEAFKKPAVTRFCTVVGDIKAKKQIAFLERFSKVTLQDAGCGTGKSDKLIPMHEKFWEPVPTKIWLTPCWADFQDSFFVWSEKAGLAREDLTNTDLADYLMDVIEDAALEDLLRMMWFSDKLAAVHGAGGVFKNATDIQFYDLTDGFFQQIIAGVAIAAGTWGHIPNSPIAQNALASYNAQMSLNAGQSLTIFRNLITNADRRLLQHPERMIICTQSIFDNWADYKESKVLESSFKNEDTQLWEGKYRSTPIIPFPLWDQYIQGDQHNGTKYNKPHRAVLTVPQNLQVGFCSPESTTKFIAFLDEVTELYHIKAGYKFDTVLMQAYLTSVAGF